MNLDIDQVLCDCSLEKLVEFVTTLEVDLSIETIMAPKLAMTMVQAEDSIDFQPFYLGEVLITECELLVNSNIGYGYCMGDSPQRAYCIAVIDALLHAENHSVLQKLIHDFIASENKILKIQKMEEYNQILKTKVDFKIMEQD